MDEIIKLSFPPEQEGITWNKREINTQVELPLKIIDDLRKTISEVNSRIDNYEQTEPSSCKIKKNKQDIDQKMKIKDEGPTQRGNEIQKELAILRDEAKRKDLNPFEKENLIKSLLKIQNEILSNMSKFSKFDSIPIRLNQIENYLEKLNNKQDKNKGLIMQKQILIEEKNESANKKQKRQVIWKFGL